MTFEAIAVSVGYANAAGALKAYRRALERIGYEEAHEALALQYERLNAMLKALWPAVERGDDRAIGRALDVMARIDRLFLLDQRTTDPALPSSAVLIVDTDGGVSGGKRGTAV